MWRGETPTRHGEKKMYELPDPVKYSCALIITRSSVILEPVSSKNQIHISRQDT
ncbi:hypothetical protein STEG23_031049 [Scotinomys teguina]